MSTKRSRESLSEMTPPPSPMEASSQDDTADLTLTSVATPGERLVCLDFMQTLLGPNYSPDTPVSKEGVTAEEIMAIPESGVGQMLSSQLLEEMHRVLVTHGAGEAIRMMCQLSAVIGPLFHQFGIPQYNPEMMGLSTQLQQLTIRGTNHSFSSEGPPEGSISSAPGSTRTQSSVQSPSKRRKVDRRSLGMAKASDENTLGGEQDGADETEKEAEEEADSGDDGSFKPHSRTTATSRRTGGFESIVDVAGLASEIDYLSDGRSLNIVQELPDSIKKPFGTTLTTAISAKAMTEQKAELFHWLLASAFQPPQEGNRGHAKAGDNPVMLSSKEAAYVTSLVFDALDCRSRLLGILEGYNANGMQGKPSLAAEYREIAANEELPLFKEVFELLASQETYNATKKSDDVGKGRTTTLSMTISFLEYLRLTEDWRMWRTQERAYAKVDASSPEHDPYYLDVCLKYIRKVTGSEYKSKRKGLANKYASLKSSTAENSLKNNRACMKAVEVFERRLGEGASVMLPPGHAKKLKDFGILKLDWVLTKVVDMNPAIHEFVRVLNEKIAMPLKSGATIDKLSVRSDLPLLDIISKVSITAPDSSRSLKAGE